MPLEAITEAGCALHRPWSLGRAYKTIAPALGAYAYQ